jgi:hypothetical protein
MRRNRSGAILGAAILAGAVALVGCASAAPRPAAVSGAAIATTAGGDPADSGNTHIAVYSINSDGPDFRSVVTGAVGDYGPAESVGPDGKVDAAHASELELRLTRGSFRLGIAALDRAFVAATSREPIYPRTCSDFVSVTAATPIVAGSGTGSYRGISGSFQMTVTLDEAEASFCRPAAPAGFRWQIISLTGPGTVSL